MNPRSAMLAFVVATVVPASAMGMASAELYGTNAYFYGRFDARIQFAPGDGVVSSFFLWKEGSDAANAYWNELDYEKVGADCHMQINNIYGNPKTQHQQTPSLSSTCTGYHDYRFEWTPTYIAWVVDGKEIRRDTGADATAYAQNATAGMTMHFNIWPGNSSFGGNINNTTLPVHQYISWVQYSSYDSGNFTVQWREDFQASGVPSGWAVGNWSSPFNLSTHNPQNVAFVNGVAVLSLTADNATGAPGTPPVDNSTGGSTGSGGSSSAGGATGSGGMTGVGGTGGSGGSTSNGGAVGTGGTTGSGGATSSGGLRASDAGMGSGGTAASGGAVGSGGTGISGGGTTGQGGTSSSGGAASGGATGGGGSHDNSGGNSGTGGSSQSGSGGASSASGAGGGATSVGPFAGSTGTNGSTSGGCSCSITRTPGGIGMSVGLLLGVLALRRRGRHPRPRPTTRP